MHPAQGPSESLEMLWAPKEPGWERGSAPEQAQESAQVWELEWAEERGLASEAESGQEWGPG